MQSTLNNRKVYPKYIHDLFNMLRPYRRLTYEGAQRAEIVSHFAVCDAVFRSLPSAIRKASLCQGESWLLHGTI